MTQSIDSNKHLYDQYKLDNNTVYDHIAVSRGKNFVLIKKREGILRRIFLVIQRLLGWLQEDGKSIEAVKKTFKDTSTTKELLNKKILALNQENANLQAQLLEKPEQEEVLCKIEEHRELNERILSLENKLTLYSSLETELSDIKIENEALKEEVTNLRKAKSEITTKYEKLKLESDFLIENPDLETTEIEFEKILKKISEKCNELKSPRKEDV